MYMSEAQCDETKGLMLLTNGRLCLIRLALGPGLGTPATVEVHHFLSGAPHLSSIPHRKTDSGGK